MRVKEEVTMFARHWSVVASSEVFDVPRRALYVAPASVMSGVVLPDPAAASHAVVGVTQSVQLHELAGVQPDAWWQGVTPSAGGVRAAGGGGGRRRAGAGWWRGGEARLFCLEPVLLERLGDGLRVLLHQVDQLGELVGGVRARAEPRFEGVRAAAREVAVVELRKVDRLGEGFVAAGFIHVAPLFTEK